MAMKTHLEVQQREDLRRDLAEGMKFVPPDLRMGEHVFHWQEDSSKIQQGRKFGKWVEGGDYCCQRAPLVVINTGISTFTGKMPVGHEDPLDTVELKEPPGSCERTGALVLRLSCEGQTDVWELFSDNFFFLSAVLDRQVLMVAAPVDLIIKRAESFSPQALQGFWSRIQNKEHPKLEWGPQLSSLKNSYQKKDVILATVTNCAWPQQNIELPVATIPHSRTQVRQGLVTEEGTVASEKKYHCQWTLLRGRQPKWIFHNVGDLSQPLEFVPISRERVVPTRWQVLSVLGDCVSKAKVISIQAPQYRQSALISDFLHLANLSIREEATLAKSWIKG